MGSRLRENAKQIFECFCEVAAVNEEKQPWILQKYPESYDDPEVLKSVPKFAYPCELENLVVQHFSFVLTSLDSKWTFGFCRHDPKTETALVILSALPWHETFYKLLNHIATLISSNNPLNFNKFLKDVYETNIPVPGASISIGLPDSKTVFVCQRPKQFQLPSIPENRNLTEYYSAVDTNTMMIVFAAMLYERRIIFISKRLSRLSACVQACNALIYPMIWQHIYIPVLPLSLLDYLLAPMPFLIGVPTRIFQKVQRSDLGDVVILDADEGTIETPFQDLASLPQDVVSNLKKALRNRPALLGDGVSRAFLRALVQLTAGYREALTLKQGQGDDHVRITFDQEAFVESRPVSMQPFLRKMLELQIFQQFIEERLNMLNSGLGFSDEFEMEACNYSDKSGNKFMQQYREWTYTMRKGSDFFRSVKNKANPAVKYAVKSVKDRGKDMKSAYKGLKWKGRTNRPGNPTRFQQPRSAPSSPTLDRHSLSYDSPSKSQSGLTPTTSYKKERIRNSNVETSRRQYSPLNPSSPEESDSPPERLDINLMHELREVIFPSTPPVDRSLKPVRSLDSLRPAWNGRLRHGPLPKCNPYETCDLPNTYVSSDHAKTSCKRATSAPNDLKSSNSHPKTLSISVPSEDSEHNFKEKPLTNDCTPEQSRSLTSNSDNSNNNNFREFINPTNLIINNIKINSEVDVEMKMDATSSTVAESLQNINKLSSEDPFEIYSTNTLPLENPALGQHFHDPFDTSRILTPYGFPNPLYHLSNHNIIVKSQDPSFLKSVETRSALAKDYSDSQDLIRLDSTNSDDDFDPLLSKKPSKNINSKQMSQSIHIPEITEGLSNPLYPYFTPTKLQNSDKNQMSEGKCQDTHLLEEYGLDFSKFNISNGSKNENIPLNQNLSKATLDKNSAFPINCNIPTSIRSQSNWTKFD